MAWISFFALSFIVWWVVLFAILPIGLRTQHEEGEVTLGTTESAPATPRMLRVVLITTLVTLVIMGAFYGLTRGLGYSFDDIPSFLPDPIIRN
jgi:predicted secreted protein